MELENILQTLKQELDQISEIQALNELKAKYLGKKGPIAELSSKIKDLSLEEKKTFGATLNKIKTEATSMIDEKREAIETNLLNKKLESDSIDIALPSTKIPMGAPSVVEKIVEEVEDLFISMGYDVVDGPEIEEDSYKFELLNIPKGHPARDAQDTFYLKDEEILLRSQTSPVQVRTMLEGKGEKPIRMICPGKTYRRDNDDATHSHQFMQIEG